MRTMLLCAALAAAASGCASAGRSTPENEPLVDGGADAPDCSLVCGGNWVGPDGGCRYGCPADISEGCGGTDYGCCGNCLNGLPPLPDGELYP
jgi:hypothetical protein